jgi:hypothetical protein
VDPTTDVFTFFRNLNVFVRNKKRFELKVMAVLLNAFGLSLNEEKHLASLDYSQSEPVSKSSVEEWTRKVLGGEAELQPKATRISSHRC